MIIKKNKNNRDIKNDNFKNTNGAEAEAEEVSSELTFDINEIDFNSRVERRQGDRRRGYRRIDDRSLVSRAQQEAITIKENAKTEGYEAGISEAKHDIANLGSAVNKFLSAKDEVYEEVAPKILEISMEVAKKIIKQEVETNQDLLIGIISDALNKLTKNEKQIVLKVSPTDRDYVKLNIENILEKLQIEAKVTVQQDMTLSKGSVIVETNNGLIDASIDTGLQIIENMFKSMQGE